MPSASEEPTLAVVIVAAGQGTRLGAGRPKAFVHVAGRALLEHAVETASGLPEAVQLVVVAPGELTREAMALSAPLSAAGRTGTRLSVVAGGATRQESVAAGLGALLPSVTVVLVHDAARALTPPAQFVRVAEAVRALGHGAIPVLPLTDTVKRVDETGRVVDTLERSTLASVQTPQGFPRAALVAAYGRAVAEFTDDAALVAADGVPVSVVEGDPLAFKVTTPWDHMRAEELAGGGAAVPAPVPASPTLVGVGTDTHAYDAARPLWLAGLHWPGEPGLAGHSDGDAVCHAITDALLSAARLGDIGSLFGTSDPRYEGARGETFLRGAREALERNGFRIGNVSVQVIAPRPRMSGRRSEAEELLTGVLGAPVSVTATTTDGLGFTGRGEGVAVLATALVYAGAGPADARRVEIS